MPIKIKPDQEELWVNANGTHHHLRQRVLRLERELDPRGPRFENAGLWRKGGGKFGHRGGRSLWMHMLGQSAR